MNSRFRDALRVLPDYLAQHVILCACAIGLSIALGLPLALLCARSRRLRGPALAAASLIQTIPGLALMALFYPILLAFSAATRAIFGFSTPALGFLPALLALTLYGLLPILRNGVVGLAGVAPEALEAADGVGMTPRQRLLRVEAPLAAPVVMAGVRTCAVWTIGTATLATSVGQTSLGNYIFAGLQTENWISVLFGCVLSAGLALAVDAFLALVERGVAHRDLRAIGIGAGALLAGAALAFGATVSTGAAVYEIGAKNFSEQYILSNLIAQRLRAAGASVRLREDLGSAVAFRALASGDIDAYVDYSGTLWTNVLGRKDRPEPQMRAELAKALQERFRVRLLGALGFQNSYAFAMRPDQAAKLHVRSLTDLATVAPQLTLGADLEFFSRPEWTAVRDAYALKFKAMRSYDPTLEYRALESGEADVITAFSSDGRILADHLTVMSDPRDALPNYDAVILVSPRRAHDARLLAALRPLLGRIDVCMMRQANLSVDRNRDKLSPTQAARLLDKRLAGNCKERACAG